MKRLIQLNLLLLLISSATAQESQPQETSPQQPPKILHAYDWKDLNVQSPNTNCQIKIISMDGMSVLKIENTNNAPLEVLLLTVENSALIQRANRIEWEMKYENVVGTYGAATRELFEKFHPRAVGGDNITNNQGAYFGGTKNWDTYYFQIRPARYDNETRPDELELKFSLSSSGTIYLRPIKLFGVAKTTGGWWSPEQSGLIGGIGGSIIGCFGGLIGWLVSKGKARRFVLAATTSSIVLGILLIIGGFVAVILKQPYSVWYALLLPGVILVLVFSLNLHSIQRRYDELEIRRMTSVDTMGS